MTALTCFTLDSPIGALMVILADGAIGAVAFEGTEDRVRARAERDFGTDDITEIEPDADIAAVFDAYFKGDITALDALTIDPRGTDFELSAWTQLRRIPAGETRSYADIASAIGRPTATRAVGRANGINPIPLIVPCHRVIGSNGSLTGFGGGLERKAWLLRHEGALMA